MHIIAQYGDENSDEGMEQICAWVRAMHNDINLPDKFGRTPLHIAAEVGNDAIANIFAAYGANKEMANKRDETPAQVAQRYGQQSTVAVLAL